MGNNDRTDIKVDTNIKVSHCRENIFFHRSFDEKIFEYKHNKKDKPRQICS